MIYPTFEKAIHAVQDQMRDYSKPVHTDRWQGVEIKSDPLAEMREVLNVYFQVPMSSEDLSFYQSAIRPNLPWADDHFETERVGHHPWNPGKTWRWWPWASSADKFRSSLSQFSHTYAERLWPKFAARTPDGELPEFGWDPRTGIRFPYGDLMDVVDLLVKDPTTRQAFIPIWFPEDTGVVHGERVPCTIGYHLIQRNGYLHVFYPIRSCDFVRHFRDDLYLCVRLVLWVLAQCRSKSKAWGEIDPGLFTFWAGSMHCFISDYQKLFGRK